MTLGKVWCSLRVVPSESVLKFMPMTQTKKQPRVLFAATESGIGKTTIVAGLLRFWTEGGRRVQPFKIGPDYIDPGFYTAAAMRVCRNLDSWLLKKSQIKNLFLRHSAEVDLSIVEGMMGRGSSAEIAKLLDCPVILILDASKMARSAAAIVKGFQQLDPKINCTGVIFNFVASAEQYQILKKGVEKECRIPCLGFVKPNPKLKLPEQHLGLVPVEAASGKLKEWFDFVSKEVSKNIDHKKLLKIAAQASNLSLRGGQRPTKQSQKKQCRIAYAKDEAFHFYYPDNIEMLESLGAEMIPFSPLYENKIPDKVDALYFGGSFPENAAAALAANKSMLRSVRDAIQKGVPTYAECGGLMYLCQKLILKNKKAFKMVGVLSGEIVMTDELQNFGYTFVEAVRDSLLFKKGEKCRGHEFHYSCWHKKIASSAYRTKKKKKGPVILEGFATKNVLASYVHLHFLAKPILAKRLIAAGLVFRSVRSGCARRGKI